MARTATYGPVQLGRTVGLQRWQVDRGLKQGLIPAAAVAGRWTQEQVDNLVSRRKDIVAVLGEHPGYGAWRVADMLQAALGDGEPAVPDAEGLVPGEVWACDVETLAARGALTPVGVFKSRVLYDARQVNPPGPELLHAVREVVAERLKWWQHSMYTAAAARRCGRSESEFAAAAEAAGVVAGSGGRWALGDVEALATGREAAEEVRGDRLLTADQAAAHLGIRRCDLEHARAAGWLAPHTHTEIRAGHRLVTVPLFRAADVDAVVEVPGVNWAEVRGLPAGRPSPLLQWVGPGRSRAQLVRGFAGRLAETTGVRVWARYRPATDRWLMDWAPDAAGEPTLAAAEELLAGDPAHVHSGSITLLTASGRAAHRATHLSRPGAAVVVDTETTALDGSVIEIAVRDAADGELLLNTLVTPPDGVRITPKAQSVHGITPGMLTGAPTLDKIWDHLAELVAGRTVLAYNAEFDISRLRHDAALLGLPASDLTRWARWECLMTLRGNWEGTTSWLPLGTSYHPDERAHRAASDTDAEVRLLHALAGPPSWWE